MNDDDIIKASKTIGTIAGSLFGVLLTLGLFIVLALVFPINPDNVQGWFAAWIQGVFCFPNWIISWFKDPWYIRAPLRCKSYNFWCQKSFRAGYHAIENSRCNSSYIYGLEKYV